MLSAIARHMQQRNSYLVIKDSRYNCESGMHDERKKHGTLLYIASVVVVFVND